MSGAFGVLRIAVNAETLVDVVRGAAERGGDAADALALEAKIDTPIVQKMHVLAKYWTQLAEADAAQQAN